MVSSTLRLASSSILRATVARSAPRVAVATPLRVALQPTAVRTTAPAFTAVRGYAASAGLGQQEIQNRIVEVLKSFEKVDPAKVSNHGH